MNISRKQHKNTNSNDKFTLIPGLPNHLAQLILTNVNPFHLSAVCRPWRHLIYSPSFPPFFSIYAIFSSKNTKESLSSSVEFMSINPNSSTWISLPSPPPSPPLLHCHPSFISRKLPIQSISVSGHLVVVAASTNNLVPALTSPLVFNPISNTWCFGPPLTAPRRWCATGSVGGAVYVASGIGLHYNGNVARSVEKWDLKGRKKRNEWRWERMQGLKDGRFSREEVEAVGYKGKLYMVNVKGNAPKQGSVYDVVADRWEEMPVGMLAGWNGPVGADNEEVMYVVDEEKCVLRKYNEDKDSWEMVVECLKHLKGAEKIEVRRGKICVVCAHGSYVAVVDVAATPAKIWVVNPPEGKEVVAAHVLPRMSLPEE